MLVLGSPPQGMPELEGGVDVCLSLKHVRFVLKVYELPEDGGV